MIEKIIELENIHLTDFLGVNNANVEHLQKAFTEAKIISRGNKIMILGPTPVVISANGLINKLLAHYEKHQFITTEIIDKYLSEENSQQVEQSTDQAVVFGTKGAAIKAQNPNQQLIVDASNKHDLVFAVGPAGTGKTYIAVSLAVRALKNRQVKRIIITRPAVEAGENLGFLPGDLKEKLDPYLRPIYDALFDMIPAEKLKFYSEQNIIEIAPLAYMRGRTLSNAFILLDEAQNTTPNQMKMFLTRLGENSKMIVNGDISQIDLPRNQKSGLKEAIEILKDTKGIAVVQLSAQDVIRHKLVKNIVQAYNKFEENKTNNQA